MVGEYTAKTIAENVGMLTGTVRSYAKGPRYLYGTYCFEAVKKEKNQKKPKTMNLSLEEDWERTRQQLLRSGADLSRIMLVPKMPKPDLHADNTGLAAASNRNSRFSEGVSRNHRSKTPVDYHDSVKGQTRKKDTPIFCGRGY